MKSLAILAAVVLAGCATPQPQPLPVLTPDVAQGMAAADLCLGVSLFRAGNAAVAAQEIQRRGINCQDHAQAVNHLAQQRAQTDAILLQQLAQPVPVYQPQPYQVPLYQIQPQPQTVCNSQRIGGQWQTVCR